MANTVRTQSPHSGATNQNLRAHNLSLALRHILANPGAINRAGIAAQTGISRATMSRLVDELIATGLVEESDDKLSTGGRGRPTSVLSPASGTVIALGLQVNISVLGAYLVDLSGNVLARETLEGDFSGSDPQATLRKLARMGRRVLREGHEEGTTFLGSALALPGLVSGDTLVTAPNLGWKNIPFDELTHPLHDLHVTLIANEADLAAFAVAHPRPGVPEGPASFIYVSGEVGIGGGLVINHQPLSGAHGWSGEIGHICVEPQGNVCSCGARGCLETIAGLKALCRAAGLEDESSARELTQLAGHSAKAQDALANAGHALGQALAGVVNTVDISQVYLGGLVAETALYLLPTLHEELETRVLQAPWYAPAIDILPSSEDLSLRGGAFQILERILDDPIHWKDGAF
ncbi:MarR family transcriptional regulator [Actinomyces sp. S6-Spd3]|uniref:ROK family transcriptional regulator n=1 Tax=Actinomyces sp. S6-Spd3 TaxID=1284680 RepID=UPI00050EC838|nr:ROK family transcriptional regulator [Actinomyces sp. S6-Spd3]KGF05205.1 MarR family transcriptional regulator [Actinomyces sp. S6-Spd3]